MKHFSFNNIELKEYKSWFSVMYNQCDKWIIL